MATRKGFNYLTKVIQITLKQRDNTLWVCLCLSLLWCLHVLHVPQNTSVPAVYPGSFCRLSSHVKTDTMMFCSFNYFWIRLSATDTTPDCLVCMCYLLFPDFVPQSLGKDFFSSLLHIRCKTFVVFVFSIIAQCLSCQVDTVQAARERQWALSWRCGCSQHCQACCGPHTALWLWRGTMMPPGSANLPPSGTLRDMHPCKTCWETWLWWRCWRLPDSSASGRHPSKKVVIVKTPIFKFYFEE